MSLTLPPTHYTTEEGGEWFAWPASLTFDKELLLCYCNNIEGIRYKGLWIHSLKWIDREWDCKNGPRKLDIP